MHKPTILIAGAGLGGATLAHGLMARGFDVQLADRDHGPDSREQGYRISINRNGFDALGVVLPVHVLTDVAALEAANVGRAFTVATGGMTPLVRFGSEEDGAMTVQRPGLRRLLTKDLPVRWNEAVVRVRDDGEGVEALLAGGGTIHADLVVGCDGATSSVREAFPSTGTPRVVRTDVNNVAGAVVRNSEWDRALPLNLGGAVQYLGPHGRTLFVSFCEREDGTPTVLWALSGRFDEPDVRCELANRGWHPHLRALVEATPDEELTTARRFVTTAPTRRRATTCWPTGRVTLLGDAAHPMPPTRGLGGNTAFADAAQLCALLDEGVGRLPLRHVIAEYERDRDTRARAAVGDTMEALRLFHVANPVAAAARGIALRIAGRFVR